MTPDMHDALHAVGQPLAFKDGEALRQKGTFAPDLLLIISGQVDCILSEQGSIHLDVGPGTIVGEIGFLTGQAATATLRAVGPVEALSLDAHALQRLQQETPTVASKVLRHLAHLLTERSAQNKDLVDERTQGNPDAISVVRCSTLDQIRTARRVHYNVHCLENGLDSAQADHEEGVIADDPDRTGTTFIAYTGVQVIGMMRVQPGAECGEDLRRLHGVLLTDTCAVITANAVQAVFANDRVVGAFINAIRTFAVSTGAEVLLVHCPPHQVDHFVAHGCSRTGPDGMLDEIGPSVPMVLHV